MTAANTYRDKNSNTHNRALNTKKRKEKKLGL